VSQAGGAPPPPRVKVSHRSDGIDGVRKVGDGLLPLTLVDEPAPVAVQVPERLRRSVGRNAEGS
jgi:hypothetical protein